MTKFKDVAWGAVEAEDFAQQSEALIGAIATSKTAQEQIENIIAFNTYRNKIMTFIFTCHVRSNLDVNNEEYKENYKKAMSVYPLAQSVNAKFYGALMMSPFRKELTEHFGQRIFEIAQSQTKTISAEIVPLIGQEFMIADEYNKIIANGSFEWGGKTLSFPELQLYMESTNADERKKAHEMWSAFFEENEEKFDDIYDRLITNRVNQAKALGYETYTKYAYDKLNRTDYSEEDVKKYRDGVIKYIVPLNEKLKKAQAERLGLGSLLYYDESTKFASGNANPVGDSEFMVSRAAEMFSEMNEKASEYYNKVIEREFYDLDSQKGKKQGGFCVPIVNEKLPFVFANFNGTAHDLKVLVHEVGHGYQTYSCMEKPLFEYTFCTYETGEVHSMSMEFLSWPWTEKYMGENTEKYKYSHIVDAIAFMPYGCLIDEFQHEIYNKPEMSKAERKKVFAELEKKYFPSKNYGENEFLKKGTYWYKQPHLFNHAFYYIDYVLAQLCALQVWDILLKDYDKAFKMYDKFCKIGGEEAFTIALESAGFKSPFNENTISEVTKTLEQFISSIDDKSL